MIEIRLLGSDTAVYGDLRVRGGASDPVPRLARQLDLPDDTLVRVTRDGVIVFEGQTLRFWRSITINANRLVIEPFKPFESDLNRVLGGPIGDVNITAQVAGRGPSCVEA